VGMAAPKSVPHAQLSDALESRVRDVPYSELRMGNCTITADEFDHRLFEILPQNLR
jgi:hypothetical protein